MDGIGSAGALASGPSVPRKSPFSTPTGTALTGAAILGVVALAVHVVFKLDCDDAYIHLRIARNWANGLGPVFNAGERVEVSTSPVWLALLTLGLVAGLPGPTVAWLLALLAAAACGAGTALLARRLAGPRAGLIAPLVLVTQVPFAVWDAIPMEHALCAAAVVWAVLAAVSAKDSISGSLAGLAAALAALVRPEALLLVPFLVALAALTAPPEARMSAGRSALLAAFGLLGAVYLWRYSYYGSFVPNPYVAKMQGLPVGQRLRTGLLYVVGQFIVFEAVLFGIAVCALRKGRAEVRGMTLLVLVFLGGIVWTGGDWCPYSRLAIPIVPLLCVVAAVTLDGLEGRWFYVLAAGLVFQMVLSSHPKQHQLFRAKLLRIFTDECGLIGASLTRLPPGLFATESLGIIGYLGQDRPILDFIGGADPHIARTPHIPGMIAGHDHSDVAYVIARAPALVMPYSWPRSHVITDEEEIAYLEENHDSWASGEDLVRSEAFRAAYVPYDFVLDDGEHLRLWRRRDFVIP